jgi:hypothetical protein
MNDHLHTPNGDLISRLSNEMARLQGRVQEIENAQLIMGQRLTSLRSQFRQSRRPRRPHPSSSVVAGREHARQSELQEFPLSFPTELANLCPFFVILARQTGPRRTD